MNKAIMEALGFAKEVEQIELGNCPFCHETVIQSDFRDERSAREFEISGLCMKCQDETFCEDEAPEYEYDPDGHYNPSYDLL